MCQLLGMNCNTPTDIHFSFAGFRQRGGQTDIHTDGFGIVFFEKNPDPSQGNRKAGIRQFHDDKPSFCSPVADLVNSYPIKAMNVISHIRKATQGTNCLANTHPFVVRYGARNGHLRIMGSYRWILLTSSALCPPTISL